MVFTGSPCLDSHRVSDRLRNDFTHFDLKLLLGPIVRANLADRTEDKVLEVLGGEAAIPPLPLTAVVVRNVGKDLEIMCSQLRLGPSNAATHAAVEVRE